MSVENLPIENLAFNISRQSNRLLGRLHGHPLISSFSSVNNLEQKLMGKREDLTK